MLPAVLRISAEIAVPQGMKIVKDDSSLPETLANVDDDQWWIFSQRLRILLGHGMKANARRLLEQFMSSQTKTKPTMQDSPSAVLPARIANALEGAGYDTILSLANATDAELSRVRNLGEESIASIRKVVMAVRIGSTVKVNESTVDIDPVVSGTPRSARVAPLANGETDVIALMVDMLVEGSAALAEVDRRISHHEEQLAKLKRLRSTLAPKSRVGKGNDKDFERQMVEKLRVCGPMKPGELAKSLGVPYMKVYHATKHSTEIKQAGGKLSD